MDKLIWSGPRESDISGLDDIFLQVQQFLAQITMAMIRIPRRI